MELSSYFSELKMALSKNMWYELRGFNNGSN